MRRRGETRPAPPAPDPDDARLVEQTVAGDARAFSRLVECWRGPIYNLCRRMLRDPEDAAEATQETFLAAFR